MYFKIDYCSVYPYRIGLNTLKHSANTEFRFHYTTSQHVFNFVNSYDRLLYVIIIPKTDKVHVSENKFRCDKIIIEKIMPLWDIKTIQYLISMGADIHACSNRILRSASESGYLDIVEYLVSLGADIHAWNNSASLLASKAGHIEIVKYLVSLGADIRVYNNEALGYACANGNLNMVKYLISVGADMHAPRNSALRWASIYGRLNIVQYLVSIGADIHEDQAVKWASFYGHLDIVEYLVSIGADIHVDNDYALRMSLANDHLHVAQYLRNIIKE